MGEHLHQAGEWMLSYRFMTMSMDGNRTSTRRVMTTEVLQSFPVAPTSMTSAMHMLGAMYAPTDDLTLSVMLPYVVKSMDHLTRTGSTFTTRSDGVGDLRITALYRLMAWGEQQIHLNLGLGTPSGSINEQDDTPAGPDQVLPYPMQTGSGTWNLFPGVTYLGQTEDWSWGAQITGSIFFGRNSQDYALGNRGDVTAWGAMRWNEWLSNSIRLDFQDWGNIRGADPRLNPAVVPTADPGLRGGRRLDLLFGVNLLIPEGPLRGNRLALEGGVPTYQWLNGPQLEADWVLTAGWQWAF